MSFSHHLSYLIDMDGNILIITRWSQAERDTSMSTEILCDLQVNMFIFGMIIMGG